MKKTRLNRLYLRVESDGRIFIRQTFGRPIRLELNWGEDTKPLIIPAGPIIELLSSGKVR